MSNLISISVRLDPEEVKIVRRIQANNGRPGLTVSQSDAMRMLIHDWDGKNPDSVEQEKNPSEN